MQRLLTLPANVELIFLCKWKSWPLPLSFSALSVCALSGKPEDIINDLFGRRAGSLRRLESFDIFRLPWLPFTPSGKKKIHNVSIPRHRSHGGNKKFLVIQSWCHASRVKRSDSRQVSGAGFHRIRLNWSSFDRGGPEEHFGYFSKINLMKFGCEMDRRSSPKRWCANQTVGFVGSFRCRYLSYPAEL